MGRFDMTTMMTDAWRVFNNMLVSVSPLVGALIGIGLLGMAVGALVLIVRRSYS